jgi:hypothetical protein
MELVEGLEPSDKLTVAMSSYINQLILAENVLIAR